LKRHSGSSWTSFSLSRVDWFEIRAVGPSMRRYASDSVIWIHSVDPEHGQVSARSLPAQPGGLVVLVDDVDSHYRHAMNGGATIDSPPVDQPYGQREYGARDPEGNLWYFATRLR
jgi:MerR family transcriptional regulator, thiopeptide resistance regulator